MTLSKINYLIQYSYPIENSLFKILNYFNFNEAKRKIYTLIESTTDLFFQQQFFEINCTIVINLCTHP